MKLLVSGEMLTLEKHKAEVGSSALKHMQRGSEIA